MSVKSFAQAFLVFALTLAATLAGYEIGYVVNSVVTIWPATAIVYWGIRTYGLTGFIGTVVAGFLHSIVWLDALPLNLLIPLSTSLCGWAAVLIERRLNPSNDIFSRLRNMLAFFIGGIGFLSLSSAIVGNLLIALQYSITLKEYGLGVWNWYLADYTGGLMLAPFLCSLPAFYKQVILEWQETLFELAISLSVLLAIFLVFDSRIMENYGAFSPMFLALPGMILLSSREFSTRICLNIFLFTLCALLMTSALVDDAQGNAGLRTVQFYLVIVITCGLSLHSMRNERSHLIYNLAKERRKLEVRVRERTIELEREVSAKNELAQKMEALAHIDPLTKLYNRRYFSELAVNELKLSRCNDLTTALCMIDIDFFKKINDTYGHQTGDLVLIEIANILIAETRTGIDSVVRLGGEEFAILMPNTSVKLATDASERIRRRVESYDFKVDEKSGSPQKNLSLTVSVGVIQCPTTDDSIDYAIDAADKALYVAKNKGRNRVVCGDFSSIA